MKIPPIPSDEASRLAALRKLGILDTEPDEEFDAIVRAAALACDAPICAISLIDEHRLWLKAQTGLGAQPEMPRDVTFCAHAILGPDIFEVPDALQDPRFADIPLVIGGPDARFYAGMPLATETGSRLGTLCILDRQPRRLTETQREVLRQMGLAAASALQSWGMRQQQKSITIALERERQRMANLIAGTDVGTWEWNISTGEYRVNERWAEFFGLSQADSDALTIDSRLAMTHPDDVADMKKKLQSIWPA